MLFRTNLLTRLLLLAGSLVGVLGAQPAAPTPAEVAAMQRREALSRSRAMADTVAEAMVVNPQTRAESRAFYRAVFFAGVSAPSEWTGSLTGTPGTSATGTPGTTATAFKEAVRTRINWYRAMAGLPAQVALYDIYSAKSQQAALMMAANNQLSHYPTSSWLLYTAEGAEAAGKSNIALGSCGVEAIDGYMTDPYSNNTAVGHRRWLIYPQTQTMGTGDVPATGTFSAANSTWVQDGNYYSTRPAVRDAFVAWPTKGYVPYTVIPARWSFAYPGANFASATVTMTRNGVSVAVVQETLQNGYGENTLAWIPEGLNTDSRQPYARPTADVTYAVTISGITGAPQSSYSYNVIVFDPDVAAAGEVSPVVSGPAQPVVGVAGSYTTATPTFASSYQWRSVTLGDAPALWGAETGTSPDLLATTSGTYTPRVTEVSSSGAASYHLCHPSPTTQLLTVPGSYYVPVSTATLSLSSWLGYATSTQTAHVQISTDEGISWADAWSTSGTGSLPSNYTNLTIPLSSYVGRLIQVRFAYTYDGSNYYPQTNYYVGWLLDDIRLNGVKQVQSDTPQTVTAGQSFVLTPAAVGQFAVQARSQLFGQYPMEWGPVALFSAVAAAGPSITGDPASVAVVTDAVPTFTVSASGSGTLAYRWQVSTDAGVTWTNLDNDATYDATTTSVLQVKRAVVALNGRRYRCAVTDTTGTRHSAAATLTVTAATPALSWPVPASITYGTALSATQLNAAAATITGSYTYTPAAGTVLNAGAAQTLRVSFTPTDSANYTAVSATVSLTVNQAPLTATADPKSKNQGAANPVLTITYTGFVNGDTVAVLDALPSASTTATTASAVGDYPITLLGGVDNNYAFTLVSGTLSVVATTSDITVNQQPLATTVVAGTAATFSVTATSSVTLTYQWQVSTNGGTTWANVANGTVYSGVGTDTLTLLKPTAVMKGYQYRCVINDGVNPAVTTTAATLTVKWSQFVSLSARALVGTGDQTLILGFVFAGGGKPTMVRGVGPGLVKGDANLAGQVLADPVLTLNELQTGGFMAVASNDNWGGAEELRTKMSALGMGALDDTSTDAVMLTTPTRAVYTAQISGANQTTGLALAEVYDANFTDKAKRLTALSVRNQVGTGSGVLIVGFVLSGDAPKKLIIRGVGPGLVPTVAEALVLANPTLQLNKLNTTTMTWSVVGANDDWGGTAELTAAMKAAGMGALDADSKDAVLLLELPAGLGIYTAQLSGVGETTGLGLVEIYEAP